MVTLDDEKRLLASCPRPLKDVLIIMLDSGLRNGEVIPLFTHVSLPSKVLDLPVQLCVPTRSVVTAKLILACSVMWIPQACSPPRETLQFSIHAAMVYGHLGAYIIDRTDGDLAWTHRRSQLGLCKE